MVQKLQIPKFFI